MSRSRFDLVLGLLFGLMLSIPARAAFRPSSAAPPATPEEVQKKPSPNDALKILEERVKLAESKPLFFFKDSVLAETKAYSKEKRESVEAFVSRRVQSSSGPRKELRWSGRLDLHIPLDWSLEATKENQGYFFHSDDQLVRGSAFLVPNRKVSKAQLLNAYLATLKAQAGDKRFEMVKGEATVPEAWTGVSYSCLTRVKIGDHWLYQRRFLVFDRNEAYVFTVGSWRAVFEVWDPLILEMGKDLTLKVTERLKRQ